jgi:hypothetical protein
MKNLRMGRPVTNKHKVPKAQWNEWSNHARSVFNRMYHAMRPTMQFAFIHPKAPPCPRIQWETTRWNAAWEAACIADGTSHAALIAKSMKEK